MRSYQIPLRSPVLAALALALFCSACARHRPSAKIPGGTLAPGAGGLAAATPGTTEVGYASWYGDPYNGRRAADGEIYDKNKMTAAHRTLPFQTVVKVTNLENERSVTVRITDRGPFIQGRIIDLSLAAARKLAMIGPGTALVRLQVLADNASEPPPQPGDPDGAAPLPAPTVPPTPDGSPPAPDPTGRFAVQVAAFQKRSTAERLQRELASRYGGAFIEDYQSPSGVVYRVRVGPRPSLAEAERLALQLQSERLTTFVVRLDP